MIGGIVVVSGLPVEVVVTKKQKYERSDTKSFKKKSFHETKFEMWAC